MPKPKPALRRRPSDPRQLDRRVRRGAEGRIRHQLRPYEKRGRGASRHRPHGAGPGDGVEKGTERDLGPAHGPPSRLSWSAARRRSGVHFVLAWDEDLLSTPRSPPLRCPLRPYCDKIRPPLRFEDLKSYCRAIFICFVACKPIRHQPLLRHGCLL